MESGNILESTFKIRTEYNATEIFASSVGELVNRLVRNRTRLVEIGSEIGLSPPTMQRYFDMPIQLGPAEQAFPIPTVFGNDFEMLIESFQRFELVRYALAQTGLSAQVNALLPLAMDSIVAGGDKFQDRLILPFVGQHNERMIESLPLTGSSSMRRDSSMTPYSLLYIPERFFIETVLTKIENSYTFMIQKSKLRKVVSPGMKRLFRVATDTIKEDILKEMKMNQDGKGNIMYYNFIIGLNRTLMKRIFNKDLPMTSVDTCFYEPFLREGIPNIFRFLNTLRELGFIEDDEGVFRYLGGRNRMTNVLVSFQNECVHFIDDDTGDILFSVSKESPTVPKESRIYPAKKLAYFFAMSGLMPFIYADDHGPFYEPYVFNLKFLRTLGLQSVAFPYRAPQEYRKDQSNLDLYDFYLKLLFMELQ